PLIPPGLPMLHSMTGFARHTAELSEGVLSCELRSVNHRWLDVQLRLPDELRPAEGELRKRIGGVLKRGKVDCSLHLRRAPAPRADLALNQPVLDQLHAAFTALA